MAAQRQASSGRPLLSWVRRRGGRILRRLGWRRGIHKPAPKRLVISYLFAPTAETSANVVAKRIRQWAQPVDVIASTGHTGRKPDPTSVNVARQHVATIIRIPAGKYVLDDWHMVEDFAHQGMDAYESLVARGRKYRDIYSRSMVPASHVLAAWIKLRHPHLTWIAEFSDPLRINTHGELRTGKIVPSELSDQLRAHLRRFGIEVDLQTGMLELIEYVTLALADTVVFTNEYQKQLMLDRIGDKKLHQIAVAKCEVWPHPVPDDELYHVSSRTLPMQSDKLTFGYFGIFFGKRTARDLIEAFGLLDPEIRGRVRLDLYVDKPKKVREIVAELHLDDVIQVENLVPYLDFLHLTTQYDWLVVTDAHTADVHPVNPYIPSKLSDYRGAGRNIWALVEDGSLMSQAPAIDTTPLGDIPAAAQFITDKVKSIR